MTCEDCGWTLDVRHYDDPDTDFQLALCPNCAHDRFDDDAKDYLEPEEDPDDEFRDTCITAADYYREGDY